MNGDGEALAIWSSLFLHVFYYFICAILITIATISTIAIFIGLWKIFKKAGEKPWKSLIPFYNIVILFKISGISPWIALTYLLIFVPSVGWFFGLAISFYQSYKLVKAFGLKDEFALGLTIFPINAIFYLILAFDNYDYIGPKGVAINTTSENDESNKKVVDNSNKKIDNSENIKEESKNDDKTKKINNNEQNKNQ